jgi:hypothetical protein
MIVDGDYVRQRPRVRMLPDDFLLTLYRRTADVPDVGREPMVFVA